MSSSQWEALPQRARKRRPAAGAGATPAVGSPPPQPTPPDQQRQQEEKVASATPPAPPKLAAVAGATPASDAAAAAAAGTGASDLVLVAGVAEGCHSNQRDHQTSSGNASSRSSGGISSGEAEESRGSHQQNPCRGSASSLGGGGGDGGGGSGGGGNACSLAKPTGGAALVDRDVVHNDGCGGGGDLVGGGKGPAEDMGRTGGDKAAAVAARHAAVAAEVDARSKITRFSEGLEGSAGADGGAEGANFEYLDHTADVQLHSWGDSIERAMEGALAAMFNTITDIARVDVDPALTREMEIEGHDAKSLLFNLLDEFLFLFHSEGLAVKRTTVSGTVDRGEGKTGSGGPAPRWRLKATAEGETFDLSKHPQGTEVKAITYSNMQINEGPGGRTDIYVIVDI